MATEAQIAANQANAKLSTGPRTEPGKASSARNATRHGLCGSTFIVADDEREIFDQFIQDQHSDLQPEGALQQEIFDQTVLAAWNLRRLSRIEAELISPDDWLDPLAVESNARRLQLLSTYRSRAERSFHKGLAELRRLQEESYYRCMALPEAEQDDPFPALPSFFRIRDLAFRDQKIVARNEQAALEAMFNAPLPKTA